MEKIKIDTDDDKVNSNDYPGLIIGLYCRPNHQGYHYVLESCRDDGQDHNILKKVEKYKGKKAYLYIFESYEEEYFPTKNLFEKECDGKKLGKIFGEGLIKDVKDNRIIYQYFTHYLAYVDIKRVAKLFERYDKINRNEPDKKRYVKKLIRFGLPLTKAECDQISSLAGVA